MENPLSVGSSLPSGESRVEPQEALHKAIETKVDSVYEAMNPSIEAVPGEKPATLEEKGIRDITLEERALDRAKVLKEIRESPTFRLQKLYFAAQSTYDKAIDSFLGGSWPDLQIEEYLQDIENFEKDVKLDDSEIEVLQDVKQKSQEALKQARYFSSIVLEPDASTKGKYRKESTEKLQKTLNDLPAQGKMLIPAGYFQGECHDIHGFLEGEVLGHTIELEFTKIETEENTIEYRCVVFNTGKGLDDYHTKTNEAFLPAVYKIPSDKIESFIEQACLFSSLEKKKDRSAMNEFYELLEKTGKRDFKEEGKYHAYKRQAVGNCTQESYDVWLQQQCSEKDELYKRFSSYRAKKILQESEQFVSMPTITVEHQIIREKESPLQDLSNKVARSTSFFLTGKSVTKTYKCEELKIKGMLRHLLIKNCSADLSLIRKYIPLLGDDKTFLLDLIEQNPEAIKLCSEKIGDREFVLKAVMKNGLCLQYLPDEMKNDELIVFLAVNQNWKALEYASSELKGNRAICLLAMSQDMKSLQLASDDIKNDATMKTEKLTISNVVKNLSLDMKNNKDVAVAMVKKDGTVIKDLPDNMKKISAVIFFAIVQNEDVLLSEPKYFKDPLVVFGVFNYNSALFLKLNEEMRSDEKIANTAVRRDGMLLRGYVFGSDKEKNKKVALAAVGKNGMALQYVPEEERDVDIVTAAVKQNKGAYEYVPLSLKGLPEIEALSK